ncbi:hypothetical protein ACKE5C_19310 (plasmid) [Aneurinibacillus thermoaerophilus]|uniref:Uncharacterized protein n=1 Tax=Aneurinibacillus thermoaerophilus TaxID=143495 RepID=A0ABX8YG07_ANETH|nr:hypothetical protein [Aneurinibacillus thermoaerophilus]QYY44746.1 hypothetical protein K3F53_19065 [Aneurinibacillus thermoaerophilus]
MRTMDDITEIKIAFMAWGGMYGKGIYEVRYYFDGLIGQRTFNSVIVPVSVFKEKGLVRRIDHHKKADEWLNTAEGKRWLVENYLQGEVAV